MDKMMEEVRLLMKNLSSSDLDVINEVMPAQEADIDVKRIEHAIGKNQIDIITAINWIKTVLNAKANDKGAEYRTAKNLMLVLYALLNPKAEIVFEDNSRKKIDEIKEMSDISLKIQKNAFGYYGTKRWKNNLDFWKTLIIKSSNKSGKK